MSEQGKAIIDAFKQGADEIACLRRRVAELESRCLNFQENVRWVDPCYAPPEGAELLVEYEEYDGGTTLYRAPVTFANGTWVDEWGRILNVTRYVVIFVH